MILPLSPADRPATSLAKTMATIFPCASWILRALAHRIRHQAVEPNGPEQQRQKRKYSRKHCRITMKKRRRRALYAVFHGLNVEGHGIGIDLADRVLHFARQCIRPGLCADEQVIEQASLGFLRRIDRRTRWRIQWSFFDVFDYADHLPGLL